MAITGASGAIYGVRLVQRLLSADVATEVIVSRSARRVLDIELGLRGDPAAYLASDGLAPRAWEPDDLLAPPACGAAAGRRREQVVGLPGARRSWPARRTTWSSAPPTSCSRSGGRS